MPTGVQVTIGATAGAGGGDTTLEAQFFLTGTSTRGDVTKPIIARSYAEFTDLTGARTLTGSAHDAVRAFFAENNGVGRVVFARVVGPGTVNAATVTLKDRAGGGGVNTLVVSAANPGPWGAGLSVTITDSVITNTYDLAVNFGGQVVESYKGLSSPAAAVTATANSLWVRLTNAGSATAAPNNNPLAGTFSLAGGADDVANVALSHLTAALARFTPDYGPGIVAVPGQPGDSTLSTALATHAAANNRTAVISPAAGTSYTTAITTARSLRSITNSRTLRMVYPWVSLPADGEAGARTVSPEGAYAGRRAATIGQVGVWQPPAGEYGTFQYVTGPEVTLTQAQRDALVDDAVIPIVGSPTTRIYGDRSLAADEVTWRFGVYSDLANAIAYDTAAILEPLIGAAMDGLRGAFFADVRTRATGVVARYADQGALAPASDADGTQTDPGYVVDLSANSPTTISLGQAIIDVAFRPDAVAELIKVRLTKTGFSPNAA